MYVQPNLVRDIDAEKNITVNVRPGFGLNGVIGAGKLIDIRYQVQGGYSLNRQYLENGNCFAVDIRLGFGLDHTKIKREISRRRSYGDD